MKDRPPPFIVSGNGGYHNLHKVHSKAGDKAEDTGAELKYACDDAWGYVTLTIDKAQISGASTKVDRQGNRVEDVDSFEYWARPVRLENSRQVRTL